MRRVNNSGHSRSFVFAPLGSAEGDILLNIRPLHYVTAFLGVLYCLAGGGAAVGFCVLECLCTDR